MGKAVKRDLDTMEEDAICQKLMGSRKGLGERRVARGELDEMEEDAILQKLMEPMEVFGRRGADDSNDDLGIPTERVSMKQPT